MTRERAKELLPVIQAYAEGKEIQYRKDAADIWRDVGIGRLGGLMDINVEFECQWRIKPEPRVWWAVQCNQAYLPSMFMEESRAKEYAERFPNNAEVIKVQEVL